MRSAFCETAPVLRLSAFAIDGAECRVFASERNCLTSAEVQGFSFTFFFIRLVPVVKYMVLHYSRVKVSKLTTHVAEIRLRYSREICTKADQYPMAFGNVELPTLSATTVRGSSENQHLPLQSTSGNRRIHSLTAARK